jgi:hypothetical protein
MTTTSVYASVYGALGSQSYSLTNKTTYQETLKALTGQTAQHYWGTGQKHTGTKYEAYGALLTFVATAMTGSVESASIFIYRQDDGTADDDHPFTVNVRSRNATGSKNHTLTTASGLASYPLWGSLASADFATGGYVEIANTSNIGYLLDTTEDHLDLFLSASTREAGQAPSTSGDGMVWLWMPDEAGTTYDPYITVVHGNRPEIPTIKSPVNVGYTGSISLTANADDPNGGNVHMHWDYSTDGGANWSACANSPSAAAGEGTDITIAFTVPGSPGDIINLRCLADDGTNQSIDYAYVTIANGTQTNLALWRSAGTLAVGDPISGVTITRPVSAPSSLSFRVDNFDAGEADIADDDELVLTLATETAGISYSWRGFVREKRVSDIVEVYAEDISYKFASLIVTRTLADTQTVGTIVRAIVEDPTGAEATGIVCTVAEVADPLSAGNYISVTAFDGQGRPLLDWLNDLAEMIGAAWRCWHDGTNWRFDWWVPADNAAWAVACKDNIEYSAESASQARVLNAPMVTRDRRQYVNRVFWWWDNAGTWELDSVETAAVTADTEAPIEMVLSTKNLDTSAAESLANAYLDAYSVTRVTVEDVQVFGIRDLDLNKDVTLTLSRRGITATAYPITCVEYRVLDQGHVTSITVGDPALDGIKALQRLQRRLQDVTAEVRS